MARPKILLVTQTYPPDPAAVGQHFHAAAEEFARRGFDVCVFASAVGYDNPDVVYPNLERMGERIEVRRFTIPGAAKHRLGRRAVAALLFNCHVLFYGLFTPGIRGVLFTTSPPFVGLFVALLGMIRRIPIAFWAMDLNPEQLIALGKIKGESVAARVLGALSTVTIRRSALVIALDDFMASRISKRAGRSVQLAVVPPWSTVPIDRAPLGGVNAFRERHGFGNATLVMYSGNHALSNPVSTLLEAIVVLRDEPRLCFAFVGGGAGKQEVASVVQREGLTNTVSLPYEPIERVQESLSAADVHVVTMGSQMAGVIHPSKVYAAMAVGRAVLYVGPMASHITALLDRYSMGWRAEQGDVAGVVDALRSIAALSRDELQSKGSAAAKAVDADFTPDVLCGRVCDAVQRAFGV